MATSQGRTGAEDLLTLVLNVVRAFSIGYIMGWERDLCCGER